MEDFINSLILNLSKEEDVLYNASLKISPMFRASDKESIANVSPLYRVALIQNNKYIGVPRHKTFYNIRDDYPEELKKLIGYLNTEVDSESRRRLLILKSILSTRFFNLKEAVETDFNEFSITAGTKLICVNCSSTRVTIENKSKRSADEPTETFYKCQDCSREFYEKIKINNTPL